MPNYAFHHIHHEAEDVNRALEFYREVFEASIEKPVERKGVLWGFARIGSVQITVTNRDGSGVNLGRVKGLDHFALTTDDFDQTLKRIKQQGINIWMGPLTQDKGQRIIFISGPDNIKIEVMEKI